MSSRCDFLKTTVLKSLSAGRGSCAILHILISLIIGSSSWASPSVLTYQGRILKSDGSPLEYNNVSFLFQITDPSGSCVLYQEQVTGYNMVNSGGVFDVSIGAGAVQFPLGGASSILDAFNNTSVFSCGSCTLSGGDYVCVNGSSTYSSSNGDSRKLRVSFYDGSGWRQISPDSVIRSVPFAGYALSAQKLGNNIASDFVTKAGLPNCSGGKFLSWNGTILTCATVQGASGGTVTEVVAGNAYLSISNGTSTPTINLNVGQGANTVAAGDDNRIINALQPGSSVGGDLSGSLVNPTVNKIQGVVVSSSAPLSGQFLKFGGSQWGASSIAISDITNLATQLSTKIDQSQISGLCSANQTLVFISVTGTWTCTTISNLDGNAIATGVINSARLPAASGIADGIVNQLAQSFAGLKTFLSGISVSGNVVATGAGSFDHIKLANSSAVCDSGTEGAIRYNSSSKRMEFCNGSVWGQLSAGTIASITVGNPNQSVVKSGPVSFVVTYGSAADSGTISLSTANISFSGTDFTGCSVTGIANTSSNTRTVTINGCTGTGTVAISIAAGTANSTTGDPAPGAGPSAVFAADNSGPEAPTGVTLGSVPVNLSSSPTISYVAATDVGGSTVASYQVQIVRTSDSAVISAWTSHASGTAVTGLSLSPSTQYSVLVRAVDAVGNIGASSSEATWTSINGFAYTYTISANTANYNLRSAAIAAGWDQVIPLLANVTVASGVYVYSTSVTTPAFVTGTMTVGSTLTITNNGYIVGARYPSKVDKTVNQAYEGGAALRIDYQGTIYNNGQIVGGSGSGGPGEGDSCGGCGGGNGGSSGGMGGPAIVFNADATIQNTSIIYGAGGGGAGGGGAYAAGYGSGAGGNGQGAYLTAIYTAEGGSGGVSSGGNGGTYGQPGANGGDAGNGMGYGGAGGYAMILNGRAVTLNGSAVVANSSYVEATWIAGTKGRIAP